MWERRSDMKINLNCSEKYLPLIKRIILKFMADHRPVGARLRFSVVHVCEGQIWFKCVQHGMYIEVVKL